MPEGGTLTISVDEGVADSEELDRFGLASAGPYVRLAVADTGHGIPEEVRERLFEPFFTTKEVGKGTGLGLSTVYGIVREAGGAIAVDSTPGAGARFSVYLPVGQAADVRVPSTGEPAGLGGSETLLVVEDDASLRLLLREALNERGYRVHEAAEGGAALRILDDPPQDLQLLIVDSTLPGAGGAEVASRFMAQIEGLRVLLVSGYPSEALLDLAESVPGVEFLQKPFSPATLLRRVRQLLDRPVSEDRVAGSP